MDGNKANASIKGINTGLSSMEQAAGKAVRGSSAGIDGLPFLPLGCRVKAAGGLKVPPLPAKRISAVKARAQRDDMCSMGYRPLSLLCRCGRAPASIDEVGLGDEHQLVIHWWCDECQRVVYASRPLLDCWRDCPAAGATGPPQYPVVLAGDCGYDGDFLKTLGIRQLDEA